MQTPRARRISREYQELVKEPPEWLFECTAKGDALEEWNLSIEVSNESPLKIEYVEVRVYLCAKYPFTEPTITILRDDLVLPHWCKGCKNCEWNWSPALRTKNHLELLKQMFDNPNYNPQSGLIEEKGVTGCSVNDLL